MKTLVLGLGTPILNDDSAGLRVAEDLEGSLDHPGVTVVETSTGGLGSLDLLAGYKKAIIIDAIQSVSGQVEQVYRLAPDVLDTPRHAASPHDVNVATTLELGNRLGLASLQQIVIFAIEVADAITFSEECKPEMKRAVTTCDKMIVGELNGGHHA